MIRPYDLEDALIAEARAAGAVRLAVYRPPGPMVVLGAGSRPEIELDLDACAATGIPLTRRRGGGCAVVLDPGNVVVALACPVEGLGGSQRYFARISAWLIDAMARIGIPGITMAGVSDLALEDRKVGGACIHRTRDLLHYSTSILVEPDLRLLDRLLRHPPREPAYRRGRPHLGFVRSLADHPGGWTAARLAANLGQALVPMQLDG